MPSNEFETFRYSASLSWDLIGKFQQTQLSEDNWNSIIDPVEQIIAKCRSISESLIDIAQVDGGSTVTEAYSIIDALSESVDNNVPDKYYKFVISGNVDRYEDKWSTQETQYIKKQYSRPIVNMSHPAVKISRKKQAASQKLIFSGMSLWPKVMFDDGAFLAGKSTVVVQNVSRYHLHYLLAVTNSGLMARLYSMMFKSLALSGGYMRFGPPQVERLPIRTISFTTPAAERAALVAAATAAYAAGDTAGALAAARAAIESGKTDVVHDLLAGLAQRMIDLNKQKQAEVKRFLGWLEGRLQIKAGKASNDQSSRRDLSRPNEINERSERGETSELSQGRDISRRDERDEISERGERGETSEPSQGRDISRRDERDEINERGENGETSESASRRDLSRPNNERGKNGERGESASYRRDISRLGERGAGIDSLPGKSILQNYLGDYQKNERELPWRDFLYRLHQNRNRFNVSLSNVEGEIEQEYERSLAVLLPIKRDLARTDALIDKIVYRLYGLTDAEIELIERPQYQQALTEAKRSVVADETITDDDARIAQIGENVLRAAEQFFQRVEPTADEQTLDAELPGWRDLPPASPTFLLTGDYNLRTLPEQMDFSTSVVSYTKAVEVTLYQRIFAPFRDSSGYSDADCNNNFLRDFMTGKKHLTLGSFMIILSSSKETALRNFIAGQIKDAATRVFGTSGLVTILNDKEMGNTRNDAAHDEVLSRADAKRIRTWAFSVLALV